jgi:hypothetical protein
VSYSSLGRSEEAREALEIYKKSHPECINLEYLEWYLSFLPLKSKSDKDRLRKLYLKAGLGGDILPAKSD